jgi:hypothetical protein
MHEAFRGVRLQGMRQCYLHLVRRGSTLVLLQTFLRRLRLATGEHWIVVKHSYLEKGHEGKNALGNALVRGQSILVPHTQPEQEIHAIHRKSEKDTTVI